MKTYNLAEDSVHEKGICQTIWTFKQKEIRSCYIVLYSSLIYQRKDPELSQI